MTTITSDDGAPDPAGAVDAFAGLWKLLPKLVHPSWHKHAHSGMYQENRHKHEAADAAVEKAKRREQRKKTRFARALVGEHTRARVAA